MDKVLLKFFADVLYIKGLLCYEEIDDVYNAKSLSDLDEIIYKMERGEYNVYRGESYNYIEPRELNIE